MPALSIRSVLVASDLSNGSAAVVACAGAVAAATGAQLHVVHALEFPSVDYTAARTMQNASHSAERALEVQADRTVPRGAGLLSRWVTPLSPHHAILHRAREVSADLIVLGPHRGPPRPRRLGATAARLAQRAITPSLIVKRPLSLPLGKVVVGYDLSGHSDTVLGEAASWLSLFGAPDQTRASELVALHVVGPLQEMGEHFFPLSELGLLLNDRVSGASKKRDNCNVSARAELVWSDPVDETIAEYSSDADLLVLGARRNGRPTRLRNIPTSTARHASCSVLLVPERSREVQAADHPTSTLSFTVTHEPAARRPLTAAHHAELLS